MRQRPIVLNHRHEDLMKYDREINSTRDGELEIQSAVSRQGKGEMDTTKEINARGRAASKEKELVKYNGHDEKTASPSKITGCIGHNLGLRGWPEGKSHVQEELKEWTADLAARRLQPGTGRRVLSQTPRDRETQCQAMLKKPEEGEE